VLLPLDDTTPVKPEEKVDSSNKEARREAERKEKRKEEREQSVRERLDAQVDKDIKAFQDAGDPRFEGKTGKEARDAYYNLSFKERAGMAAKDLAGRPARLKEDLDNLIDSLPDAVKKIPEVIGAIGNVYKDAGIELGRKAKVFLGLQGEGAVERSSPPPSRPSPPKTDTTKLTEDEIKKPYSDPMYEEEGRGGTRPDTSVPYDPSEFAGSKPKVDPKNFGMPDPSEVPVTEPSFVQGMKDADRVAGTPISTGVGSADPSKDLMFMGTGPAPDVTTDSPVPKQTSDSNGAAPTVVIKADTEPTIKQPTDMQTQDAFDLSSYSPKLSSLEQTIVNPRKDQRTQFGYPSETARTAAIAYDKSKEKSEVTPAQAATVESTAKDLEQSSQEADAMLKRAQALQSNQEKQQTKLDTINEGIKKLEGSLLSSSDKVKTQTRKDKIDEAQRKKRKDKRRKERDKQTAKERGKSYVKARSNIEKSKAKDVYKGGGKYGGFKKGGLMKRNYP